MVNANQTPEQAARDVIDQMLREAGWVVQSNKKIDFRAGPGVAVREYQTDAGPADYVLFVGKKPVGVIEAKPDRQGQNITTVEEQSRHLCLGQAQVAEPFRAAAVRVRKHRRADAVYQHARPEAALSGGVPFPSPGDDAGMAFPAGHAACPAAGAAEPGPPPD